jgi:hypothetical protein
VQGTGEEEALLSRFCGAEWLVISTETGAAMKLRVILLTLLSVVLITAAGASSQPAASQAPLHCGSKIYIAPMENGLDAYIRAKFVEQHIPLKIVMAQDGADLVMTGMSKQEQVPWHDIRASRDKNTGAITISDKDGNFAWGGSAGDRNIWWGNLAKHGPEKVSERIVEKLKPAIQPCKK